MLFLLVCVPIACAFVGCLSPLCDVVCCACIVFLLLFVVCCLLCHFLVVYCCLLVVFVGYGVLYGVLCSL